MHGPTCVCCESYDRVFLHSSVQTQFQRSKKKKQQKAEKKKKVAKSTEKRVCFNTRIKKKLKICLRVSKIFIITVAQNLCLIGVQGRINVLHAHLQVYGKQKFETKENH